MNNRLKIIIKDLGVSQREFAVLVGASPQAVSKWMSGQNSVSQANQYRIFSKIQGLNPIWWEKGIGEPWLVKPLKKKEFKTMNERFKYLFIDQLGKSQKEIAEMLDVSAQSVSTWLRGRTLISKEIAQKVINLVDDLNPEWFHSGHGSIFLNTPSEPLEIEDTIQSFSGNEQQEMQSLLSKLFEELAFLRAENKILKSERRAYLPALEQQNTDNQ